MRAGFSLLLAAVLLSSLGCARASSSTSSRATEARSDTLTPDVSDLLYNLEQSVAAEPSEDVGQGLFLGHIASVGSLDSTPTLAVDFVTADMQPGLSAEQRQKSSWPDYFGWNRFTHSQTVALSERAVISSVGYDVRPISPEALGRLVASDDQERPRVWCIAVSGGQVTAVWPWIP